MAVQEINDDKFIDHVENNDKVIIRFYADWCGSCRLFEPKYKKLSEKDDFQEISFVDIDAENNPKARNAIGVDNLPYFAAFKQGDLVDKENTTNEDQVKELIKTIKN